MIEMDESAIEEEGDERRGDGLGGVRGERAAES